MFPVQNIGKAEGKRIYMGVQVKRNCKNTLLYCTTSGMEGREGRREDSNNLED
jgi:hypothetical protein